MRSASRPSLRDLAFRVDGPGGEASHHLPDGTVWVLQRDRRRGGFRLTRYDDPKQRRVLDQQHLDDRRMALNALAAALAIDDRL